jgi:hypothetical protein
MSILEYLLSTDVRGLWRAMHNGRTLAHRTLHQQRQQGQALKVRMRQVCLVLLAVLPVVREAYRHTSSSEQLWEWGQSNAFGLLLLLASCCYAVFHQSWAQGASWGLSIAACCYHMWPWIGTAAALRWLRLQAMMYASFYLYCVRRNVPLISRSVLPMQLSWMFSMLASFARLLAVAPAVWNDTETVDDCWTALSAALYIYGRWRSCFFRPSSRLQQFVDRGPGDAARKKEDNALFRSSVLLVAPPVVTWVGKVLWTYLLLLARYKILQGVASCTAGWLLLWLYTAAQEVNWQVQELPVKLRVRFITGW